MRLFELTMRRAAFLAACLALCVCNVLARQTTGTLRGQIKDELGGVITGASVTLVGADASRKSVATNGEGIFVFSGLAPGSYTLSAAQEGFATYESAGIAVRAGQAETLEIRMAVALKDEETTVAAEGPGAGADPADSAGSIVLRGRDLDSLSDDPDQLADDLRTLAGGIDGPNGSQVFVDGFSNTRLPPKSSILEVRINSNPFTAEQDNLGFGRIEVITKAGAEKLTGQAFFNFTDESLNARNPYALERGPYQARLFGGNVTGPIVKNKAAYFFDFERREIDENATVNAKILDAAGNVASFGQVILTPQRRTTFSARADYQLDKKNTLVARYNLLQTTADNAGIGGFSLATRAYDTSGSEHTLQLSDTMIVNASTLNVTRFQFIRNRREQRGDNSTPAVIVQDAFTGGGAQVGLAFNDTDRFELQNNTTHAVGPHVWTFGGRLRAVRVSDAAPANFGGTYLFSSLEQYRQVLLGVPGARPTQFTIAGGDPLASVNQLDFGGYVQDDWRIRPNLTLSAGARVESQSNTGDKINFAPRVAFAWAPGPVAGGKRPKLIVRGGGGIFYSRVGEDLTLQANRFDGLNQLRFIVADPAFYPRIPTVEELALAAAPQTTRRVAGDIKAPYSVKGVISVERQLPLNNSTLGVIFIHERDGHLLRSRNINAPLPGTGLRPLGNDGNVFVFESSGRSVANTLLVTFRGNVTRSLSINARYGLGSVRGDTEGASYFPADSYDLGSEYGPQSYYSKHAASLAMIYRAPWNVTISPILQARTPERFNITTGLDNNGDAVFTDRPAFAADLGRPGVVVTPFGAFDTNPLPGQTIVPRNYGRGPGSVQANLRVSKLFGIGTVGGAKAAPSGAKAAPPESRFYLMLTMQVTNLFNSTNQGPIIGNLSSPLFGRSNVLGGTARRIEFQTRFAF
jgi:hypothetical protein